MFNLQRNIEEYATTSELDFICDPEEGVEDVRLDQEKQMEARYNQIKQELFDSISNLRKDYKFNDLIETIYRDELLIALHMNKKIDGDECVESKAKFFLQKLGLGEQDIIAMEEERVKKLTEELLSNDNIKNKMSQETEKQTQEIGRIVDELIQFKAANIYLINFIIEIKKSFKELVKKYNMPSGIIEIAKTSLTRHIKRGCEYILNNNPTDKELAFAKEHLGSL